MAIEYSPENQRFEWIDYLGEVTDFAESWEALASKHGIIVDSEESGIPIPPAPNRE
jgi:hypothetical protein